MSTSSTISQMLANYIYHANYQDMLPENIATAKIMLLDYLGVVYKGGSTESGVIAAKFAASMGGNEDAVLIGNSKRVPAPLAALANAIASHSIELDDVDVEALFHFCPPIVSASLAVAELKQSSGRELLTAIILGSEVLERVSQAANLDLRNNAFHTTATAGVFGAAASAAKLLGLNEEQIVNALALAGAQCSGLMEMYGQSMQKRFNPGPTARNGVTAALMASLGFTGTDLIFEGERGFFKAFTGNADKRIPDPAQEQYLLRLELKPYACARPIHPAIDAVLALRDKVYPRRDDIVSLKVYRNSTWAKYHTNMNPRTYHEAQVSLPFAAAVALLTGDAFLDQFLLVKDMPQELRALMDKTEILVDDEGIQSTVGCRLEYVFADGGKESLQVDYPKGSIQFPMSEQERKNKFHKLTDGIIPKEKQEKIIGLVQGMDNVENVITLTNILLKDG